MAKREAGAGRGFVNPKPVNVSADEYVTPKAQYEMEKEEEERRTKEATDKAFNKASRNNFRSGGYVRAADGCAQRGKTKGRML